MNGQFSHFKLISLSQKRKSEDLNGDSTNGPNEDKKEDDDDEEVEPCGQLSNVRS